MAMAAEASENILKEYDRPRSAPILCNPLACAPPLHNPPNSASPLESASVGGVTLQCLIQCVPYIVRPPDVERRVTRQPAKFVSTKVDRWVGFVCQR